MWKEIPWTNGAYSAGDNGQMKSNERLGKDGRRLKSVILKPWIGNHGHLTVSLMVNGKNYRRLVHRLIAEVFLEDAPPNTEIDHKDGNKLDNAENNLEWVTRKENLRRAKNLGLSLDGKLIETYEAVLDACRECRFEPSALSRAASGKQETSCGYLWRWREESVTTIPQGSSRAGENPPAKNESL